MASISAAELFNVNGMVFVVTGGGTGIGKMMARALDANGAAKVYILGRRLEKLEETAAQAVNRSMIPIKCDVTSKEDLSSAAEKVRVEAGFVNTVIANSGITGPSLVGMPKDPSIEDIQAFLWQSPMEDYTKAYELNCSAVLYTLLAFLPLLDAGNKLNSSPATHTGVKSQFIATSSIAGFNRRATAGFGYGSSKAALNHMMKMLAHYLAPFHIRLNVFAPGMYPSEMHDALHGGNAPDLSREGSLPSAEVPATRMGTQEDIAGNILYLCGRGGAYCNGNIAIADGGRLSMMPGTY